MLAAGSGGSARIPVLMAAPGHVCRLNLDCGVGVGSGMMDGNRLDTDPFGGKPSFVWYSTGPEGDPDRYRVTAGQMDEVRVGGEGLLYQAVCTATGNLVALKLLTGTSIAEYERVAERAALFTLLDHPGLMTQIETFVGTALVASDGYHDMIDGTDFDVLYSVAAWVHGVALTDASARSSMNERLEWVAQIADALAALHAPSPAAPSGLVHRDVKPSNIRVRPDGQAVLVDFGVARQVGNSDMTEGVGTFRWRAPEVLSGSRNASGQAVDVWGLGAVAHWLLCGRAPELDGMGAARERFATCTDLADRQRGRAIAGHLAALLHTDPSKRPTDLRRWAAALRRMSQGRRSLPEIVRDGAALLAVATVVVLLGWGAYLSARSPDSGLPEEAVLGATTVGETSARSTDPLPAATTTTTCDGITDARLRVDPPAVTAPQSVTLSLETPTPSIMCSGPADLSAVLESLTVTLGEVTCTAAPTSPGSGSARFRWPDGSTTDAEILVGPDPEGGLTARIRSTSGFTQVDGTTSVQYGDMVGSCDAGGITRVSLSTGPIDFTINWTGAGPGD